MPTVTRLFRKFCLALCALAACVTLWAQPAAAVFGSFSIPVNSVFAANGAIVAAQISLPNTGTPVFLIDFTLPRDYQKNGEVRIVFYLTVPTGNCDVSFAAGQLRRMRPGLTPVDSSAGLTGNPVTPMPAAVNVIVRKVFFLNPGNAMPEQRPGDAFSVQFVRFAADPTDTCGSALLVRAIEVYYTLKP